MRVSFLRNRSEYVLIYDDETKDSIIEIMQANLYVRKITVGENVYSTIENTLTKTLALYRYTEMIPKTVLISTELQSWSHEGLFSRAPFRMPAIAMSTNEAFLRGAKRLNPSHFQKFNLNSITVCFNAYSVAGIPLQSKNDEKPYFISLEALALGEHGHGVPYNDYANHSYSIRPSQHTTAIP